VIFSETNYKPYSSDIISPDDLIIDATVSDQNGTFFIHGSANDDIGKIDPRLRFINNASSNNSLSPFYKNVRFTLKHSKDSWCGRNVDDEFTKASFLSHQILLDDGSIISLSANISHLY